VSTYDFATARPKKCRETQKVLVTVIDCRSGAVMVPGKSVSYGDGERLKLVEVDGRLFGPRALIETTYRDFGQHS
jgi:hypothetical protein